MCNEHNIKFGEGKGFSRSIEKMEFHISWKGVLHCGQLTGFKHDTTASDAWLLK